MAEGFGHSRTFNLEGTHEPPEQEGSSKGTHSRSTGVAAERRIACGWSLILTSSSVLYSWTHHRLPRRAFNKALDRGKLLLSLRVLAELNEVLARKRFRRYLDEEDARRFLAGLLREAEWIEIAAEISDCRDPKDNKFLELAVSGRASHIISGDADLLVLIRDNSELAGTG